MFGAVDGEEDDVKRKEKFQSKIERKTKKRGVGVRPPRDTQYCRTKKKKKE
jgi:hypothetical protein